MQRDQRTKVLGSLVAVLTVVGTVFSLRDDAAADVVGLWQAISSNPVSAILFLGAVLLALWLWQGELREALGVRSPEDVGKMFRDWCFQQGYTIQDRTSEEMHFNFTVRDFQDRPINIQKLKAPRERSVTRLIVAVEIDQQTGSLISSMPAVERADAIWSLQLEMARQGSAIWESRIPCSGSLSREGSPTT